MLRTMSMQRVFSMNLRRLSTSAGRLASNHGHGHGHGHAEVEHAKSNDLISKAKAYFVFPEHPREHQGYLYREVGNLQGSQAATIAKIAITFAWFWIFYNLWHHPENFFGHADYPDTAKWTNKELGIPDDDEE